MPVTALRWRPQSTSMKTANVLVAAQADGWIKHWHATSGRCLHSRHTNPENLEAQLYSIDYNPDGLLLATAGDERLIKLYDEQTKSTVLEMQGNSKWPGHSNRIFCVKFNPYDGNILATGGWDNCVFIYDIRKKGPIECIYGPHVCGEAIDFKKDGHTLLTGSYR